MAGKHKLFVGSLPQEISIDELTVVFNTYGSTSDIHIMQGKATSGQGCAFVVYDSADAAQSAVNALNGVYSFREDGSPPISVSWARQGGGGDKGGGKGGFGAVAPPSSLMGGGGGWGGSFGGQPQLAHAVGGLGGYNPPPPPSAPVSGTNKLFVGNLPQDIQQEAIRMVFGHYGTVTNVHVMNGKSKSGQSCAFVEYTAPLEAETAVLTLHEKYEIRPGEGAILVKYANSGGGKGGGKSDYRSSPY